VKSRQSICCSNERNQHAVFRLQDRAGDGGLLGHRAAVVERLCKEGLKVHALARSADKLAELAARTGCIPHAIDVSDLAGITRLTQEIEFDVLVNNAGVDRPGSILKADAEGIDLLVDVNLRAVLHLCRLVVPGMAARDRGHVVNISSIAAAYNFGGNSTYHATKAAVSMLSRQLRIDVFGKRVRVTEICPGRVATDIFAHVHGDSEETRKRFVEGLRAAAGRGHRERHRIRHRGTDRSQRGPHGNHAHAAGARRALDRTAGSAAGLIGITRPSHATPRNSA
jgi:NADP-dependent 3-hydroxy acid dehydrogenase YdfG